jgi:ATP-dependent Lon protease
MTSNKVKRNVAMTGEITLRGRVLPIGGLKEKIYAAARAGIKTVLIPDDNKNEIKEFDREILKTIKVIPINEAKSILEYTLVKPVNSLNITESEILEAHKSAKIDNNLKENLTH